MERMVRIGTNSCECVLEASLRGLLDRRESVWICVQPCGTMMINRGGEAGGVMPGEKGLELGVESRPDDRIAVRFEGHFRGSGRR